MAEKEPRIIKSPNDVAKIAHPSEQQFALAVLTRCPDHEIVHEPQLFQVQTDDGKTVGTLPDFLITNPKTGKRTYVEITQSDYSPSTQQADPDKSDPKEKQKRVMAQVDLDDATYVVLYAQHLERVEQATGIPIFDASHHKAQQRGRLKPKDQKVA